MTDKREHTSRLWTLQEACERLRISERTMHNRLNSGAIEGMFGDRRWKFTEQALSAYEAAQVRKSGKGAKKKRAYHRHTTRDQTNHEACA